jgi:hypothetical protein
MEDEKKKGNHGGKEPPKPGKSKTEEVSDVELEKVSGGRTHGVD